MTWYLPCTCSPEPVEESSPTSCSDTRPSGRLKSNRMPGKFYSTDRLTEAYLRSLFGTTCGRSGQTTHKRKTTLPGCGKSKATFVSPVVSRVRTYRRRAGEPGLQERGQDCGKSTPALLARYNPATFLWKTAQSSSDEDLTLSSMTLPRWGMLWFGGLYQLKPLALHTSGIVFGHTGKGKNIYPTPCVGGPGGTGSIRKIKNLPHLTEEEVRSMIAGNGGIKNPDWVEWVMGFPIGWTRLLPVNCGTPRNGAYPG